MFSMVSFLRKRWSILFLLLIILVGGFLRFYQISEISNFFYDQARDTDKIREIIQEKKLTLLGPPTSLSLGGTGYGTTYFGPVYYYLLAPALLLSNFDPVGPIIFTAFLGTTSIFLLYLVVKKLTKDEVSSLLAALFYALSPGAIEYARFIWNPNLIPFFVLLFFLTFLELRRGESGLRVFVMGVLTGLLVQLHFCSYYLAPLTVIFLFFIFKNRGFLKVFLIFFSGIILGIFPLILFDLRHNFLNSRSIIFNLLNLFGASDKNLSFIVNGLVGVIRIALSTFVGIDAFFGKLIFVIIVSLGLWLLILRRNEDKDKNSYFVVFLLFFGFLATSILGWRGAVERHYLLPLSPVIFIFLGIVFSYLKKMPRRVSYLSLIIIIGLSISFIAPKAFKEAFTPHFVSLGYCRKISSLIAADYNDSPASGINVANLTSSDRRATSFRYFLKISNIPVLEVEKYPQSDVLYVVDDQYSWSGIANNTDTWEVSSFKPKKLEKVIFAPFGKRIYKITK